MKRKRKAHEMAKISWSDGGENLFSLIKEKKRCHNSDHTPDFMREEHSIQRGQAVSGSLLKKRDVKSLLKSPRPMTMHSNTPTLSETHS